ncbi:MAG: tryptophan 7-halogenase [bacterium]|nr:tryptophan 7-halogenase [bacterium]
MPKPPNPKVPSSAALQVARLGDGRLLVRGRRGVALMRDADLEDVGPRDLAAPVRPAPGIAGVSDGQLAAANTRTWPLVLGSGVAARRIAELLTARRLERLTDGDLDPPPDLVICALEEASYEALFEIQGACLRAGVPCLFVTVDPDGIRIGPTVVPGASPCFACAQIASFRALKLDESELLAALVSFRTGTASAATFERAARAVALEARAVLSPRGRPRQLTSVRLLTRGSGKELSYPVSIAAACPLCAAERTPPDVEESALAGSARRELIEIHRRAPRRAIATDDDELVASVGIVGGGTAGYLTALALRRRFPALHVTLIESSQLPVIGVGEATTPLMPQFLHVDLGLDVHELYAQVRPTFKLDIRFDWGPGTFHYPFGPVHVLEPAVWDGDVRRCSPWSLMMSAGALPLHREGEAWRSSLGVDVAYHLDNERFVRYLRQTARDRGVTAVDARISEVETAEDGESVTSLVADDGRRFAFDLYIDCSGFRSLLLERALGSPFLDYRQSLFTDRALVATVPHDGKVAPFTLAETMSAGWCWSTPQRDADHRGYVFCSEFASPDEAEREMRRANPGMGEPRLIEFRAGRHEHFWRRNVVAMGNAYGFVEPLESTALHMLIRQIGMLLQSLPVRHDERGVPALLNRRVGDFWDYLRWFLAIHFRFNRRLDSPFWRCCRSDVDVSLHAELLDAFRERGPLSYQEVRVETPDPLWGAEGIDVLLLGQGVPAKLPRPTVGRRDWLRQAELYAEHARRATPHARALEVLDERSELLAAWAEELRRFGPAFG